MSNEAEQFKTPELSDAPMPSGVVRMSKQELWDWFQRSTRAIMEKNDNEKKFFRLTTGLHDARVLTNPIAIIEEQRKRMAGLELQMGQMQKGYKKKLLKAQNVSGSAIRATTTAFDEPFDPKDETIKRLQGLVNGFVQIEKSRENLAAMRERLGISPDPSIEAEDMGMSPFYMWLERSAKSGVQEVANAARTMMAFYQGAELPAEAQGEDSARLDWLLQNPHITVSYSGAADFRWICSNSITGKSSPCHLSGREAIDRARASAETGGVKS